MNFRKSMTEHEMLIFLEQDRRLFPPLEIKEIRANVVRTTADNEVIEWDTFLTLGWGDRPPYRFLLEVKRLWTPKVISTAIEIVRKYAPRMGAHPMILVPYLNEERLRELEAQGVSGIDLCGNGVVIVPNELLVLRTGFPNRFRWEGTIKNVYRKNSAIVARTFLLAPQFRSINEMREEITKRGGKVTLGTVSKVCQRLGADLVIEGGRGQPPWAPPPTSRRERLPQSPRAGPAPFVRWYRLLQPEKLLDLLAENYELPAVTRTFQGKCALPREALRTRLAGWEGQSGERVVLTGASSVEVYAVMAREPVQSFYCTDIEKAVMSLSSDVRETDRFANMTLLETRDDFVYFDRRPGLVASPIQCYLELMSGDTRERETANQVRRVILEQLAQARRGKG
jgi:hypothetical protein